MTAVLDERSAAARAAAASPRPRRPVWLMRQAGRYLPEYRQTRKRAGSFLAMCTNPELACEVTLQPVARYPLDAAILFSDILTIPHAMNLGLDFESGEGPRFARPVRSAADIDKLAVPDPGARAQVRDRRGGAHPPRASRAHSADRLRRQPLDRRHLHGGGRRQQDLRHRQAHDVRGARGAAPAARAARARSTDRVSECADRRRRAGRHAVRHLGRHLDPRPVPRVLARLHGRRSSPD